MIGLYKCYNALETSFFEIGQWYRIDDQVCSNGLVYISTLSGKVIDFMSTERVPKFFISQSEVRKIMIQQLLID